MANTLMNYLIPEDMEQYMSYYGMHSNKLLRRICGQQNEARGQSNGRFEKHHPNDT